MVMRSGSSACASSRRTIEPVPIEWQPMLNGIRFTKVWSDEDLVELKIEVSDGRSVFSNLVYVGHLDLADTVQD
jgi:hypothetical protein